MNFLTLLVFSDFEKAAIQKNIKEFGKLLAKNSKAINETDSEVNLTYEPSDRKSYETN